MSDKLACIVGEMRLRASFGGLWNDFTCVPLVIVAMYALFTTWDCVRIVLP